MKFFFHQLLLAVKRVTLLVDRYGRLSYSQEGEDILLARLFEGQRHGFYVDVGACHPKRFSNTALFYALGWHGINIEPNPDAIQTFYWLRPRDINLQIGISDVAGTKTYYMLDDPALNSFDKELADRRQMESGYRIVGTCEVKTERLDTIFERHLPHGIEIDFLSVDVEGYDLQVIKSNNWNRYRPRWLLVEQRGCSIAAALHTELNKVLQHEGYELFAKTLNTLFYYDARNREHTLV